MRADADKNIIKAAVVLLSGGLDSAVTLAEALSQGYTCFALTVDYGQRHDAEIAAAGRVASSLGAAQHKVIRIDLRGIGGSALTDVNIEVPSTASAGIPVTYVPARNTLFLSLALGWAEVLDAGALFIGINAVDYSGYPDCRPEFVESFQTLANIATKAGVENRLHFHVQAPLIRMSKAQIIRRGIELGVDFAQTVSCYAASAAGLACGVCDSCRFRRDGFVSAGVPDPTAYQAVRT